MTRVKLDLLESLARSGGYWASARRFVRSIWHRKLPSLTLRQRNWLTEIIQELDDESRRRV